MPQTGGWWNDVDSWHGAFLRRHSRLMLQRADAIELGGDPPTAQAIHANIKSLAGLRTVSDCEGELALTRAGEGEWSGTFSFRFRMRSERSDDVEKVGVRLRIAAGEDGAASYRLAFDRYRFATDTGDVEPTLAVAKRAWRDEGRIDWLFPDADFVAAIDSERPAPLFAAVDMSAMHTFAYLSKDSASITEVHRHQQQWLIVPDGVKGLLLPRPTRYGLYFPVTRAFPPYDDAAQEPEAPAPADDETPKAKSDPKGLAQCRRQAEAVYRVGGRITLNARKAGRDLDAAWAALEQGKAFADKDIVKMLREKLPEALRTSKLHTEMNSLPNQTMKLPVRPVIDIDTKVGWVSVDYE